MTLQGNSNDKFPWEQPGTGNGDPSPFEASAPIDEYTVYIVTVILFICLAVIAYNWLKDKPKFKQFKQFLTDLSKGCPNETKW